MGKSQQSGSTLVVVISIIVAVIVVVGAGAAIYFVAKDSDDNNSTATTSDAANKESTTPTKAPVKAQSLPEDYPKDAAPIYQPSTIAMAMKIGTGWLVTVETKDDINDVAKSVLATYKDMGAKVTQDPLNDEGVGQVAGGNAGYGIIATYSTDDEKNVTSISYHVDPQVKN